MPQHPVTVRMLPREAAQDADLTRGLTDLINVVYAESESGLWADGAVRTTTAEVAELITAEQIAVARTADRIVGSVRLHRLDGSTGELGMLVAAPDLRGAGVGRRLVAYAERWARANGFGGLQLEVLSPRDWSHPSKEFLRAWYTRIGFVRLRIGPFEDAFPALAGQLTTPCDFTVYEKRLAGPPSVLT